MPKKNSAVRRRKNEKMQIRIFTLPLTPDSQQMEELNHFLRANKVIDVRKELAMAGGSSCWTFCVTYMQETQPLPFAKEGKAARVDYKEVLEEDAFKRFSAMRKVRKDIADKDAVPAYAVFTDAELAELAKADNVTPALLQSIPGIGKKKVEKYGTVFCEMLKTIGDETAGVSDR